MSRQSLLGLLHIQGDSGLPQLRLESWWAQQQGGGHLVNSILQASVPKFYSPLAISSYLQSTATMLLYRQAPIPIQQGPSSEYL